MSREWREHRPGQWWQLFTDAPHTEDLTDEKGTLWPPSMVVSWGGRGCCVHLHSYYNGDMPDTAKDEDVDYLHICDLDDFINELQQLRETMRWQRPEWDDYPRDYEQGREMTDDH